jgi:hypothetical protein
MGLSMSVGVLAFQRKHAAEDAEALRQELADVNRLLRSNGLPPHEEPEKLPRLKSRFRHVGQPYGWLQYLRRAVAHALRGRKKLKPIGRSKDPTKDPLHHDVLFAAESHVICHSDCEGFYVPVDFPDPLYDDLPDEDEHCIIGGILGSSQGAMRELVLVAPLLGVELADGVLSDQEAEKIHQEQEEDSPFWIERQVWLEFFETARLSIKYKTAIVFN